MKNYEDIGNEHKGFKHIVDDMKQHHEGSYVHHHNEYGKHAASFMKEHEKVAKLCGGGKA